MEGTGLLPGDEEIISFKFIVKHTGKGRTWILPKFSTSTQLTWGRYSCIVALSSVLLEDRERRTIRGHGRGKRKTVGKQILNILNKHTMFRS